MQSKSDDVQISLENWSGKSLLYVFVDKFRCFVNNWLH